MSHKPLIILTLALTLLVSFDYLNAWTAPASGNPPTGDVAAPINTGSATQNKSGTLGVNALAVFGNSSFSGAAEVSNSGPLIKFNDTTALTSISRDFWLHANNSTFYLLADRDNANNTWESPHPLEISASADGTADFAKFANQVRAKEYCDVGGNNCINPSTNNNKSGIFRCSHAESRDSTNIPCYAAASPTKVSAEQRHYVAVMCYDFPLSGSYTTDGSIRWEGGSKTWQSFNRWGNWYSCGDGVVVLDIGPRGATTYSWKAVTGSCSVTSICQIGTRTTSYVCKNNYDETVADSFCSQPKPASTSVSCQGSSGNSDNC